MLPLDGAGWVARLHEGRLSASEGRALRTWLAESADHARDLLRAEAVWRLSGGLEGEAEIQAELARIPERRHAGIARMATWSLAAALLMSALFAFLWLTRVEWYETPSGEQRMVTLPDGSTVALNTATRISVDYSQTERHLVLEHGEALFDVVRDHARPFVVQAGNGWVRALGTRFNVLMEKQAVTVSVLEGRVEVKPDEVGTTPSQVLVSSGQAVAWQADGRLVQAAPEQASRERIAAWREGKLRFDAWPLQRAIDEHNRYAKRPIRLDGQVEQDVTVSGVFRIGDTEALLQALGELLDVEAVDTGEEWLLVARPALPAG